jgi:hypothetical protein
MKRLLSLLVIALSLALLSCGGGGGTTPDPNNPGQVTPPDTTDTYNFHTNGKVIRFQKGSSVSVHVFDGTGVSGYQSGFKSNVERYVQKWNDIGQMYGLFAIGLTNTPDFAAVVVRWTESLGGNTAGRTTYSYTGSRLDLPVDIQLATRVGGNLVTSQDISMAALHEMGHALGLWDHSSNSRDVMYPVASSVSFSKRDIATLYLLYTTPADITPAGKSTAAVGDDERVVVTVE